MGKAAANGELRQRKKGKSEEDDADDELLEGGGGGLLDQFIMLRAVVFVFTSLAGLIPSGNKDVAVDDAAAAGKAEAKKEGQDY